MLLPGVSLPDVASRGGWVSPPDVTSRGGCYQQMSLAEGMGIPEGWGYTRGGEGEYPKGGTIVLPIPYVVMREVYTV